MAWNYNRLCTIITQVQALVAAAVQCHQTILDTEFEETSHDP